MGASLVYSQFLQTETCCVCGVEFGIPTHLQTRLRETHDGFYCPNGHRQVYTAETEAEKLQKELNRQKERTRWAEEENEKMSKKLKKTEKRIAHGVCPCCNRTFVNLQRHMTTKHKGYVKP